MTTTYDCCDESRRDALKGHPTLTGIDFLDVVDNPGDPLPQRQTTLIVHLINEIGLADLNALDIVIEGGDRVTKIVVTGIAPVMDSSASPPATPPVPPRTRTLRVTVDQAGDFSTYTLRLLLKPVVVGSPPGSPPAGGRLALDPVLSAIPFSFKVNCPSEFDCKPAPCPPHAPEPSPAINYLAKDYASFRQLMLDRLALLVPDWPERNPADLGITLVELLAYVGDYLSYEQDAVGTEAYLHTARKRTSVRRHTRLVDYFMHDGCNARTWVQLQINTPTLTISRGADDQPKTQFLTKVPGLADGQAFAISSDPYRQAMDAGAEVFELMHDDELFIEHNELSFYTWGDANCCLPVGATSASLIGQLPNLKAGMVLVLAEMVGPKTGLLQDADPTHRQAVRLTKATRTTDPLALPTAFPPGPMPPGIVPQVTNIEWHPADALTFALCLSSRSGNQRFSQVSRAFGNIVLADHGQTIQDKTANSLVPAAVPASRLTRPPLATDHCNDEAPGPIPARYRPRLSRGPLTSAAPFDSANRIAPASAALRWSLREPLPVIWLRNQLNTTDIWTARRDLLDGKPTTKAFVVETETDGLTQLRFGDGVQGARPAAGTAWLATYRIGNGTRGNIGADKLVYVAAKDSIAGITRVWNPLPARGGTNPETMEEARQKAPTAFRRQERAVTPDDYEDMARRVDDTIQRTACTFRWTGSWRTAFLSADRLGGLAVDAPFEKRLRAGLERYRMAGYDLEVDGPLYVSLEMEMVVCVDRNYFASDVKAALLTMFTRLRRPDGQPGLFHPDQFTFGQPVWLSPFYAAAQATAGVLSVQIDTFRRQGSTDTSGLTTGKLPMARLEMARLDNDPNFPDRGVFTLTTKGGR